MNTFKKIAAVTMAAVTLATTMITSSAYTHNADIELGPMVASYDAEYTIHYSELYTYKYGTGLENPTYVSFAGNNTSMREGMVLFAVDFNKKSDVLAGKKSRLTKDEQLAISKHMASIRLDDPSQCYMTKGYYGETVYCLEITESYIRNHMNVIASPTHYILNQSFDVTGASVTNKESSGRCLVKMNFKIEDHNIIPDWYISYGNRISQPDYYNVEFTGIKESASRSTTGEFTIAVEASQIGMKLPVKINYTTVGYMTVSSNGKVTFQNI